ncbi:MAG: MarR family transcriptional regulator [Anaerolineales bacterium]|nr:MarR family transcriptional regulator [Anaerolineales bacterium]
MPLAPEQYLKINQAIFSLANAYNSRMLKDEEQIQSGLQLSDRSVLMVMRELAPLNSRQLAEAMDINPGTISLYVQRLVERGLVERERDQQDRRNWWLHLTIEGINAADETVAGTVLYTQDFLSMLDDAEQRQLHDLLQRVAHGLGHEWQ